jgi:hypothetical protein
MRDVPSLMGPSMINQANPRGKCNVGRGMLDVSLVFLLSLPLHRHPVFPLAPFKQAQLAPMHSWRCEVFSRLYVCMESRTASMYVPVPGKLELAFVSLRAANGTIRLENSTSSKYVLRVSMLDGEKGGRKRYLSRPRPPFPQHACYRRFMILPSV